MAERRTGRVIYRQILSPILELFRIAPQDGTQFPDYKPGQYIALSRDNCRITRRVIGEGGEIKYVHDHDESGNLKRGQVTHSYSISSAPIETKRHGYLEFYVVLEMIETDMPGRLSESLFHLDPESDSKIFYVNKITGVFTLDRRVAGYQNVAMVGTGSGLAPFASMIKQLHFEASEGKKNQTRYTLFHVNRTFDELGYHQELLSIEAVQRFDFVYVPSVSRPTPRDFADLTMGKGRANNVLRSVFGMPLKEEQDLQEAMERGANIPAARRALEKTVRPALPQRHLRQELLERMDPQNTVILTCGNPNVMADIKYLADANRIQFEKEDW